MSYSTFKTYLESGGFTILSLEEEFTLEKKEKGYSATLKFECDKGHVKQLTLASFKNRKSKLKGDIGKFCSQCGSVSEKNSDEEVLEEKKEEGTELPISVSDEKELSETSLTESEKCSEKFVEEETEVSDDGISETVRNLYSVHKEFFVHYESRRDSLQSEYNALGSIELMYSQNAYTKLVLGWLTSSRNILTGTYINERDVRVISQDTLIVRPINYTVRVQTVLVHNLNPEGEYRLYRAQSKAGSLAVVFVNAEEIIDVWYFIHGKRPYSLAHKHDFGAGMTIAASLCENDIEYAFFEKRVLAEEVAKNNI